jgi:protein-disulfide isomerase
MLPWRAVLAVALGLVSLRVTTCRSPGEAANESAPAPSQRSVVTLPGVDTGSLTAREKGDWSSYVSELLAPCPDQPVSVAQCVTESRDCKACLPAAKFLVKHVQSGKSRAQVEAAFRVRFAADQVKNIELGASPWKGAPDAPVVIVEWADFECSACGRAAPLLDELVKKHGGELKLVFKNYPLASHKNAEIAARAALAAHKQNKFWQMHHELFAQQTKGLDEPNLKRIAQSIGLDMKRFEQDMGSEAIADAVSADRKQGSAFDLQGTPTIYVNGRYFDLSQFDLNTDLEDWIKLEVELAKAKTR